MGFGSPKIVTRTVDSSTWTELKPGKDCNHIKILNSSGQTLKLRSDSADSSTEITLIDGAILEWESPRLAAIYREQDVLFYAQIQTGNASVRIIAI